jgi:hypothetical protein
MPNAAVPVRVGLYLALIQLLFALCWTVYVIYLPALAAQVGIPRSALLPLLMLDQAIFTITDLAIGVASDRVSKVLGRLGRWVAWTTVVSCAAFLALPFVVGTGAAAQPLFLGLTLIWVITSSALRAPPLMLLGKYTAKPAIPWMASLAMLGFGVAGAAAPYLTVTLRDIDPRIPFVLASVTLVLATFGLTYVERLLAGQATPLVVAPPPKALSPPVLVFALAVAVLALGYQFHFSMNSAALFLRFAKPADLEHLMPVFWIGFNIALLPAGFLTKRYGGLAVMGGAGLLGAVSIVAAREAASLEMMIGAQLMAGAAWGCVMMSAVTAALAIGSTGAEGRTVGLMFSLLALATFARVGALAIGLPADPAWTAILQWLPSVAWAAAGAMVLYLAITQWRDRFASA